jgi:hypothetical protein
MSGAGPVRGLPPYPERASSTGEVSRHVDGGSSSGRPAASTFTRALERPGPVRAAELRPPPADLDPRTSLAAWIDAHHGVRRLLDAGRFVLYTDDAVGAREEESLRLLTSNLNAGAPLDRIVPFLTCKHTLSYCLMFARRAASYGFGAVTVTGGDSNAGPPRCLPRSRELRALIREHTPALPLGTWVNPHRGPREQADFLEAREVEADYYLTQVVSHHDMTPVDEFLEECERRGLRMPGMFGVFYFRSGREETLERLARFFPVPVAQLRREFASGASPEDVAARTIRALEERGVENVYVCNLGSRRPAERLAAIERLL